MILNKSFIIIYNVGYSLIKYQLFLLILFLFIKLSSILCLIAITEYSKLLIWVTVSKLLTFFRILLKALKNETQIKKIMDKNK
jgi:hypothetical protein